MPKRALCDQCGRELTEEDFRTGGAFRDHADVLCPDCYQMYLEDERRRERERKRRDSEAAIDAKAQARRVGSKADTAGVGARRGTTRSLAAARRSGRAREPGSRHGLIVMFILAAAVAFIAAIGLVLLAEQEEEPPAPQETPPRARATGAPSRVPPAPSAPALTDEHPPSARAATPETEEEPESEKRTFKKSLFGPGGQFGRQPEGQ